MTSPAVENTDSSKARPRYGLVAAVVLLILALAGGGWYWRLQRANAAEAAAKAVLEPKGVILVADGGHIRVLNSMQPLDDATFAKIGDLGYLHTCNLSGSQVTDAQMAVLGTLTNLLILQVDASPGVTSQGMANVKGLTSLERLFANDTSIGDDGLEFIQGMQNLNEINISRTKITDAGLKYLTGLPRLENLRISGTEVTDAAVESLSAITSLRNLDVSGTKMTPAGVQALRAANSKLVVEDAGEVAR